MSSNKGIGDRYQQETCYSRLSMAAAAVFNREKQAEPYKRYPDAAAVIALELPASLPKADLWEALQRRRSVRDFSQAPLSMGQLSLLVFAAQGVTGKAGDHLFRAAPSAGALYPVETYVCINRAEGFSAGLYHLDVPGRALELISPGSHGKKLAQACLGQDFMARCAAVFVWTAIPGRSKWKYRERAWRYMYMDAGHIAENLYLAAAALGLGCCGVGAFFDPEVNELLGLDGQKETAIYLAAAGPVQA